MQSSNPTPYPIDIQKIRDRFPALASETVFLENAGGSQVPIDVANAIHEYLLNTYVQLDAGYELSTICTEIVDHAHIFMNTFVNGSDTGSVILGPSCTQLCTMLAECYAQALTPGDEIIVTESGHEANIGPWMKLADRGFVIKQWNVDPETFSCPIEQLDTLLTARTRIVAITHVSNLLGEIVNLKPILTRAHAHGARVVVDGVAYAPHRSINVADWNVDWYVFSNYKVYGPHMATLYGSHEAISELTGLNHFFINRNDVPYKFELGGVSHEGCAGLLALSQYISFLASLGNSASQAQTKIDHAMVTSAFDIMTQCERPLQKRLVEYLCDKPKVRIIGPAHAHPSRVGTVSFVHENKSSAEIVDAAHSHNIGIRNGHMYAYRLCQALGIDTDDGVVRVSFVHYNTLDEIDGLIQVLDDVL